VFARSEQWRGRKNLSSIKYLPFATKFGSDTSLIHLYKPQKKKVRKAGCKAYDGSNTWLTPVFARFSQLHNASPSLIIAGHTEDIYSPSYLLKNYVLVAGHLVV